MSVPGTETDTIVKNVEGKSLQETELGQCYCTLEINIKDDVLRKALKYLVKVRRFPLEQ